MHSTWALVLWLGLAGSSPARSLAAQEEQDAESTSPNYEDHIAEIMSDACVSCHRGSRARNGLKLNSLAAMLEGGSSGPALVPGDAAGSLMLKLMRHEREPFMPEDEDRLEDSVLESVGAWIEAGAPATATSGPSGDAGSVLVAALEPSLTPMLLAGFAPVAALPLGLRKVPLWWSPRGDAVLALAASPTVDLVAVGGHRQISLYNPADGALLGMLAFPEGQVEQLRFSRNGALLLACGGRGGESGLVVVFDVASGERRFSLGTEPDSVLSADISNDLGLVALGGVDGILRVYSTESGAELYSIDKHTDWITGVAFSPDGVLLASADRAGGLVVWEALTGREFHPLGPRKSGVEALAWRGDSTVLASGAQDGELALYEMEGGKQLRSWKSHGGVLDLTYMPDGRLLSVGRDARGRLWNDAGKEQAHFDGAQQLAGSCAASFDSKLVMVGDMAGKVRVFASGGPKAVRALRANPPTELELAAGRAVLADEQATAVYNKIMQRHGASTEQVTKATAARVKAEQQRAGVGSQHQAAVKGQADALAKSTRADAAKAPAVVSSTSAQERLGAISGKLGGVRKSSQQRQDLALQAAREQVMLERALQAASPDQAQGLAAQLNEAASKLEGALALARLAAEEQASLETQEASAIVQRDLWKEIVHPLRASASACSESLAASEKLLQGLAKELELAKTRLVAAESALSKHQATLQGIEPKRAAAQAEQQRLRQQRQVAEDAWGEQCRQIELDAGRVVLPID